MENLLGFLLAAFALAGSPGPNTLSLAATGAAFGPRRSLGFMIGLLLGMVLVMAVTATGMMSLFLAVPGVKSAAILLAFTYFAYLAFRIASAPPLREGAGELHAPSFSLGVGQSLVNPKAYAAMAALFSGFSLIRDEPSIDIAAKTGLLVGVLAVVNVSWLCSGALLTRYFRDPRLNRAINLAFAVLLIASVAIAFVI
jgi:threonine/homoserine/homoserine lactone efflux protein